MPILTCGIQIQQSKKIKIKVGIKKNSQFSLGSKRVGRWIRNYVIEKKVISYKKNNQQSYQHSIPISQTADFLPHNCHP